MIPTFKVPLRTREVTVYEGFETVSAASPEEALRKVLAMITHGQINPVDVGDSVHSEGDIVVAEVSIATDQEIINADV